MSTIGMRFSVLAVGFIVGTPVAGLAQEKLAPPIVWEYQVLAKQKVLDLGQKDIAAGLNQLGRDGWELTAIDGDYIFKRPKPPRPVALEDLKKRLDLAKSDVESWRERASWSARMFKKGLVSQKQADADRARLRSAEITLEIATKESAK